jgi:hypothetical protein
MMRGHTQSRSVSKPKVIYPERNGMTTKPTRNLTKGIFRTWKLHRHVLFHVDWLACFSLQFFYYHPFRFTSGPSRMMANTSGTRIGLGSRRSVCKGAQLSPPPTNGVLAEGNPDEEKIGAFGVGRFEAFIKTIDFLTQFADRLLQLVLGDWEAVGLFRRYVNLSLAKLNNQVVHTRWMDELLLEGREGPG